MKDEILHFLLYRSNNLFFASIQKELNHNQSLITRTSLFNLLQSVDVSSYGGV